MCEISEFKDFFNPLKANVIFETVKKMCGANDDTGDVNVIRMPARLSWLLQEGAARYLVDLVCDPSLTNEKKESLKTSTKSKQAEGNISSLLTRKSQERERKWRNHK